MAQSTTSTAQRKRQPVDQPGQACIAEALKAAPVSTRLLSRRDPRVASMRSLPIQHGSSVHKLGKAPCMAGA